MSKGEIGHYDKIMRWHLPKTYKAVSWWWHIVTSIDTNALIREDELHAAFEYAKSYYKKLFVQDEELADKQKEVYKMACDTDLSIAEHMTKQYELEEVAPHIHRYKEPYKEQLPVPHWVQYVFQRHIYPNISR